MDIRYVIPALLIAAVVLTVVWNWWRSEGTISAPLPRPFRHRDSQLASWRQDYPDEMQRKADALLRFVCEAFCFSPDQRYQFAPTDRIMDIYRACYPRWQSWHFADSMEIEELMTKLDEHLGVDDEKWHPDITLGELVTMIKPASTEQASER